MPRLWPRSAAALACASAGCALLAGVPGCGQSAASVPPACLNGAPDLERALAGAPGPVALSDGTPLSRCVANATSDGDLQNVGSVFSAAADDLARGAARDPATALRLGYLVGATRRGGAHDQGISAELVRRVEQSANLDRRDPRVDAAMHRGLVAGQRDG
jgi:hypothetical protein